MDASTGRRWTVQLEPDLRYVQAVDTGRRAVVVVLEVVEMVAVGAFAAGSRHGLLDAMERQLAEAPVHAGLTLVAAVGAEPGQS